jgi:hypothetical protein
LGRIGRRTGPERPGPDKLRDDQGTFCAPIRGQRRPALTTTNKGIKEWPEILAGDEVLATILDRLLHNSQSST